jgi:hypothetical protein
MDYEESKYSLAAQVVTGKSSWWQGESGSTNILLLKLLL